MENGHNYSNKLNNDKDIIDKGKLEEKLSHILLHEENFSKQFESAKLSYDVSYESYTFLGERSLKIYGESYQIDNPKGIIVMTHGFTENIFTFGELIYYFNMMGYSVFAIENRGHARSGRLGKDEYQVNVDDFDDYVIDFNTFIETIVKPHCPGYKLYGFGHSMGGLIITRYVEMYPDTFEKIIASSPMIGIRVNNIPSCIIRKGVFLLNALFMGNKYCPGHNPKISKFDKFENSGSASKARYDELTYKPKEQNPQICCGGASVKWVCESYKAIDRLFEEENIERINTPILLCQAGKEHIVDNKTQDKFVAVTNSCKKISYPLAKHEIYKSDDNVLQKYLSDIFEFIDN